MVELKKWWSRRNIGVGEMVESEKHWSRRNGGVGEMVIAIGVGEMVEHNHDCGCSKIGGL
jgi:hypothetical protein